MKKAKTDKGWAGHKLFGHTYKDRDIRTAEDKRQDAILERLENKKLKPLKHKRSDKIAPSVTYGDALDAAALEMAREIDKEVLRNL
jgi:hypothetical protein